MKLSPLTGFAKLVLETTPNPDARPARRYFSDEDVAELHREAREHSNIDTSSPERQQEIREFEATAKKLDETLGIPRTLSRPKRKSRR